MHNRDCMYIDPVDHVSLASASAARRSVNME